MSKGFFNAQKLKENKMLKLERQNELNKKQKSWMNRIWGL